MPRPVEKYRQNILFFLEAKQETSGYFWCYPRNIIWMNANIKIFNTVADNVLYANIKYSYFFWPTWILLWVTLPCSLKFSQNFTIILISTSFLYLQVLGLLLAATPLTGMNVNGFVLLGWKDHENKFNMCAFFKKNNNNQKWIKDSKPFHFGSKS